MAKHRRQPLKAKYIFRRMLLIVIFLGLIGGGGFFAYNKFFAQNQEAVPVSADPPASVAESSLSESVPESSSPESADEPDKSEPESIPVAASSGDWELILVNYENWLPEGYEPELETLTDIYRVDKRIADSVRRMFNDAKKVGIDLMICSAYRSVERQTENFESKKQEYIAAGKTEDEAVAVTSTIIAIPGTSEHHTGLALDIVTPEYTELDSGFAETPAFRWLNENAHKYGFILRYPEDKQETTKIIYEPWHYRYVGEYNATVIKEKGLCLEEYVDALNTAKAKLLADAAKDSSESSKDESSESE